jgi:membrane-bound lytic murein transglycosylase B
MKRFKKFLSQSFLYACLLVPSAITAAEPVLPSDGLKEKVKIESVEGKQPDGFSEWLKGVRKEALAKGISQATVDAALPHTLMPIDRVKVLDIQQPEDIRSFDDYLNVTVNKARVDDGFARFKEFKEVLRRVSRTYKVEPEIVVALWGIESNYGGHMGHFIIVQAMATLAFEKRRGAYFRSELISALKILDQEKMAPESLKGSWAGATGQVQFMPSSFLAYAVDFNKDGRRDIWETSDDAFASAANYLHKAGWKKGEPWGHRVNLPKNFDPGLLGLADEYDVEFLRSNGLKFPRTKGIKWASVIQPDGPGKPAFVVYDNFRVILKWNRSRGFALSVGILSDKIKQKEWAEYQKQKSKKVLKPSKPLV